MKKENLPAYSLLKLTAVIGILCCHAGLIPGWDACARMVEILFLSSGFLMAYNHFSEKQNQTSWQILQPKLIRFYPIHIFTFLLQALFVTTWAAKPLSFLLSVGILNLSLQQAWFVDTKFSYNGVSWFLSALIFCYLMTPTIKKITHFSSAKKHGLLYIFLIVVTIRLYMDYLAANAFHYAPIDLHCNPFVQMLNYSLGYITAVFLYRKNSFNQTFKKIGNFHLSLLQTLIILFYFLCCYRFAGLSRPFFIFLALPLIYIFGINRGLYKYLAQLRLLRFLSDLTLEIFMLHSFILYHLPTTREDPLSYLRFFSVTFFAALIYHLLYRYIISLYHKKRTV